MVQAVYSRYILLDYNLLGMTDLVIVKWTMEGEISYA